MALEMDFEDPNRKVTFLRCYWKIVGVREYKEEVELIVTCYFDRSKADLDKRFSPNTYYGLAQFFYKFTPSYNKKVNIIKQGYRFLKKLEYFKNAQNV